MAVDSLDKYIESVAGYVFDNDKIVTYKWLSKELQIHVNKAKQILSEFVRCHGKDDTLKQTHLLMGTLNDGGTCVEVVQDTNLNIAKKKYKEIIAEHIYSLQKSLPDIELLAISEEGDIRFSAIKCKESIERTHEELHILRWGATASTSIPISSQTNLASDSKDTKPLETISSKHPEINCTTSKKSNATQKKGFENFFGKASTKQTSPKDKSEPVKSKEISPKRHASSPKKKQQKGGINNFFHPSKSEDSKTSPEQKKVLDKKEDVKQAMPTKSKEKSQIRGKKRNRSNENHSAASKRKRIVVQSESSDSEAENENENDYDASYVPPPEEVPPPKERTPTPPREKIESGKRRVLKLVDQTYEEDGYIVTKKVHVYESCSEDETEKVESEVKKPVSPESRPDPKGKKSTKQTTLMNFFKKS